jgi:hypothetical protein
MQSENIESETPRLVNIDPVVVERESTGIDEGRITPDVLAPVPAVATPVPSVVDPLVSTSEHNPMGLTDPNQLPEPRLFGLTRERGSVSPFSSSPSSIRSASLRSNSGRGGTGMNLTPAVEEAAFGLPSSREDDELSKSMVDGSFYGDRSGSTHMEDGDDDAVDNRTTSRSEGASSYSADMYPIKPHAVQHVSVDGGAVNRSNLQSVADAVLRNATSPLPHRPELPKTTAEFHSVSAAVLEEVQDRRMARVSFAPQPLPHQQQEQPRNPSVSENGIPGRDGHDGQQKHPPVIPDPPSASTTSFLVNVEASHAPTSLQCEDEIDRQQKQRQQQQRLLEVRCVELEDMLRQAEAKIQVLEHSASLSKLERTNDERNQLDKLRIEFQEKEARLMAAAAEDHEQELRFLKSDMEVKVQSLQQQMAQERDVFEREREYFEQLVSEANARAEQAERQFQRDRAKHETAAAQYQKQHDRELQIRAEKLAESMALLDEREDQVSKLKVMVQTLQSKLSEHAEGTQLAEDEVDELHHENEALQHAVEKLEEKCKDLQRKNAELQSDSNKLSEQRVSSLF